MQVTLCDKCGRRCERARDSDGYPAGGAFRLSVQHPTQSPKEGGSASVDLCAVCVHALAPFLPPSVQHLLPSKERVALVSKLTPETL